MKSIILKFEGIGNPHYFYVDNVFASAGTVAGSIFVMGVLMRSEFHTILKVALRYLLRCKNQKKREIQKSNGRAVFFSMHNFQGKNEISIQRKKFYHFAKF